MFTTSATLTIAGILCLLLSGVAMYRLTPRDGKPPSWWTSTDMRATTVTMALLVLMLAGVGMLAKAIF